MREGGDAMRSIRCVKRSPRDRGHGRGHGVINPHLPATADGSMPKRAMKFRVKLGTER